MSTTYTPPPSAPFHRLLTFYSTRHPSPTPSTIRLTDSLTGNLALGLDFPVALAIAVGRHIFLRNTSWLSLDIHVPSVATKTTLLEGVAVDDKESYTRTEIMRRAGEVNGWAGWADAAGLWALAAGTRSEEKGLIKGRDVAAFQRGELLWEIERKRRGREEVLPLYRGGPISVAWHSWFVGKLFGVTVYRDETRKKD